MKRILAISVFVGAVLSLLTAGHLYLAERLILGPVLAAPAERGLLWLLGLLAFLLVLQPLVEKFLPPSRARWLAWPASLWMGLFFYLVLGTAASDLLWAVLGAAGGEVDGSGPARLRALAVGSMALAVGGAGLRSALRPPELRRLEIQLPRWPKQLDGFRIVQISDLHIGALLGRHFAARVASQVNALDPDLIAVTGDLVDGSVAKLAEEVAPLAKLRSRHGVFFVTGNHDHYSDADAWVERVRELGWRVLRNERIRVTARGTSFDLAGVEDHHAHLVSMTHREDLGRALAGRDPDRPLVLLAHDPSVFGQAARAEVDLQLSGHTHGGQLWPFGHAVRVLIPHVAGLYEENGAVLYVSRGTGFWGPPMRVGAPAEITEIVLRSPGPWQPLAASGRPRSRPTIDRG